MVDPDANRRGIGLMLLAMGAYALNDAFVKATAHALPAGQLLAVRGAFATVCVLLLALAGRQPAWRGVRFHPLLALRCVLEIAAALSSVLALTHAPLATVTAIMMSAPLIVGIASFALGWEAWQTRSLVLSLTGLAGVLGIVQPWNSSVAASLDTGTGFAVICALSLAARDLVTRRLPSEVPSSSVTMLVTVAVCGAGLLLGIFERWAPLEASSAGLLLLAAIATACGNLALISACRNSDLSVVTPFRYSMVVWSVLLGALFWHEWPDRSAVIGISLACVAGVMASRRREDR
ncbi:DMT family transporter [Variovorax sp. ZT4R33]|uniref:DMT family transporter n=1 Tax=Variovorax sp. ZT4R33 TaxID=3443743 RepID=UPI003F45E23E